MVSKWDAAPDGTLHRLSGPDRMWTISPTEPETTWVRLELVAVDDASVLRSLACLSAETAMIAADHLDSEIRPNGRDA